MASQFKTGDARQIIERLGNGAALLDQTQALFELAEGEISQAGDISRIRDFLIRWFGHDPGLFWLAWDKISGKGKANIIWSKEPLRRLLLLPADHIVQLGIVTGEVQETFELLGQYFKYQIARADDSEKLEVVRRLWEGRVWSLITDNWFKQGPRGLKVALGESLKSWSSRVSSEIRQREKAIQGAAEQAALAREHVDLSLPGIERVIGTRHLIRQTYEELERIFLSIGFTVVEGPEIETPYYNFEALNIPEHHPARDNMDTFYIEGTPGLLLRTHTSPMQIRTMEKQAPPVRIIVPGKVYRRDNPDATHGFMFHQLEGLAVDTDITFCDFKGTVEYFVKQFFGPKVKTRLRPSYFPFTEPSAEVDASCRTCGGSGCRVCKFSGWIELFGAGMVDPAVYGFVKYEAKRLSGFAWGMGVDRFAMLKYGGDLQTFFQNDARFLRQFP